MLGSCVRLTLRIGNKNQDYIIKIVWDLRQGTRIKTMEIRAKTGIIYLFILLTLF